MQKEHLADLHRNELALPAIKCDKWNWLITIKINDNYMNLCVNTTVKK